MGNRERNVPTRKDACLLVVDAQNLYYSARELYGRGARIDFKKLKERVCGERDFGVVYALAYIPEISDERPSLSSALKRLAYALLQREKHFAEQVQQLASLAATYQVVCVASGDGAFLSLYNTLKEMGKRIEVWSFIDSANAEIPKIADAFNYLDANVLVGDFQTLGA